MGLSTDLVVKAVLKFREERKNRETLTEMQCSSNFTDLLAVTIIKYCTLGNSISFCLFSLFPSPLISLSPSFYLFISLNFPLNKQQNTVLCAKFVCVLWFGDHRYNDPSIADKLLPLVLYLRGSICIKWIYFAGFPLYLECRILTEKRI